MPPDKRPNVAILNDNEFLFSYKDRLSHSMFVKGQGPVKRLRLERGDVMDFFAQLEVIVNQIFVINVIKSGGDVEKFEQILDFVDSNICFLNIPIATSIGIPMYLILGLGVI